LLVYSQEDIKSSLFMYKVISVRILFLNF
jgi:hypothetical protein